MAWTSQYQSAGQRRGERKRTTMARLLFGKPFFGTNPLDGAQPALNEWFGLYVSTQDHAQADQRTLADLNEAASAADAFACG